MTNKDEASPRQRVLMEQRWAKAREDCPAGECVPASRFHIAGCERRTQKVKVTNLNTGAVAEATIVHSDVRAVKNVLDQHEKQAVHSARHGLLIPFGRDQHGKDHRHEKDQQRIEPVDPHVVADGVRADPGEGFTGLDIGLKLHLAHEQDRADAREERGAERRPGRLAQAARG